MHSTWRNFKTWLSLFIVGVSLSLAIAACTSPQASDNPTSGTVAQPETKRNVKLTLVSYAVTKSAYANIIPLFVEEWQKKNNQKVTFKESYGGSGSQTRAVLDGLEADVVNLALAADVQKIEKAKLIDTGWEKELPNDSIATNSVVAFSVREGNPKNIKTWDDLVRSDVEVITANPKTSGVARWNFLAVYAAGKEKLKDAGKTQDYVQKFYKNSKILTKDARESTEVFGKQGQGDVLLNYENEVILAEKEGSKLPYIIPTDTNISIDAPIAVIDANAKKHGTEAVAKAFAEFLFTAPAQREFAKLGFRPVLPEVSTEFSSRYPKVTKLVTAKDYFGGWDAIQKDFFADGAAFDQIQSSLGKS